MPARCSNTKSLFSTEIKADFGSFHVEQCEEADFEHFEVDFAG